MKHIQIDDFGPKVRWLLRLAQGKEQVILQKGFPTFKDQNAFAEALYVTTSELGYWCPVSSKNKKGAARRPAYPPVAFARNVARVFGFAPFGESDDEKMWRDWWRERWPSFTQLETRDKTNAPLVDFMARYTEALERGKLSFQPAIPPAENLGRTVTPLAIDANHHASRRLDKGDFGPPEPDEEAGLTLSFESGKLDLVFGPETDSAFDRDTQIALQRRINQKIEQLRPVIGKIGNAHPTLASALQEYAGLVSKSLDGLDVVNLWAVGTGLLAHSYSLENQHINATFTEPLEPPDLALLVEISSLHAGFIFGFSKGRELTERADRARIAIESAALLIDPAEQILYELSQRIKLVSDRARRLAEILRSALIIGEWKTTRAGYASYALVKNALIQLGKVALLVNDKGGTLAGGAIATMAVSHLPPETPELAAKFLLSNARNILAFAAPFPELRAWTAWIIDWFDNEQASLQRNSIGSTGPETQSQSSESEQFARGDHLCDFDSAPRMIVVPAGRFLMGSLQDEGDGREYPQHQVTITTPFAVGIYPVTRREFAAFVEAAKYKIIPGAWRPVGSKWEYDATRSWFNPGFKQGDDHPAVCVNWHDAKAYVAWLKDRTGKDYRLLSEAEWEYCCRAGTESSYNIGDTITSEQANFRSKNTSAVSKFPANSFGLHDMHGNVWEWCEDNWHIDYRSNPPTDGSLWWGGDNSSRVIRGGSWFNTPDVLRSAYRLWSPDSYRNTAVGIRVARTL